ncbi:hypothetical protein [Paenibacillus caui]|uniref:hypothetical protein n=1 Tax=Paenibacillus caui TaxID=2873927 RepID=UPI001CA8EB1F|nr:hypothetical protein [Paenibacillus caui]
MIRWKMLLLAGSLTLFVALLSKPILSGSRGDFHSAEAGPVMTEASRFTLTESNLVDILSSLPLNLKIARAELRGGTLAVDLKLKNNNAGSAPIYEDMAELAALAIERTRNIHQLRLRLVAEDSWTQAKHLLMAADIRREELSPRAHEVLSLLRKAGNGPLDEGLKDALGIIETGLWRKSYPAASSSGAGG